MSSGSRIAGRYLAAQLESFGYRGATANGSFFQTVPITRGMADVSRSGLTLTTKEGRQTFAYERDYMLESPMVAAAPDLLQAELVFVGYGISSPARGHDDYAGLDVQDKVVITVSGAPQRLKQVELDEAERGRVAAEANGALGLIVISECLLANYSRFSSGYAQRPYFRITSSAASSRSVFQVVQAGPALVGALADLLGIEERTLISRAGTDLRPAAASGSIEVATSFTAEEELPGTNNVVGLIEGADPQFKDECIVVSAHYDHSETTANGEVYNGADDNASGTAAVLEIARAFAVAPRPRRSILVVFYAAEELGLLGSSWLTDYEPLIPCQTSLQRSTSTWSVAAAGRLMRPRMTC